MGAWSLVNPAWGSRLVRLVPDPARPGGFAEFRASYGGLFLASHALAGAALLTAGAGGEWASLVLAAAWAGAAVGRVVSIQLDAQSTGFNWGSVGFETLMALSLAAPFFVPRLLPG